MLNDMSQPRKDIVKEMRRITSYLIETKEPIWSLRPEVMELKALFEKIQTSTFANLHDIASGETYTENGLAVSPTMAILCVNEYVRTIQFLRGVHQAVSDLLTIKEQIRVLYAGCGPFATLAIPLMTLFPAEQLTFTLIDMHEASIDSARSIVESLGLTDSVSSYEIGDAGSYSIDPKNRPDIIQMEIMQVCLEKEPQVAVTRHLITQAPEAILIPEEIHIDLRLVNSSREFSTNDENLQRERIPLGDIFRLSRETVQQWDESMLHQLPAESVEIPETWSPSTHEPRLFTTIKTYGEHILEDYSTSLTCPKPLKIPVNPGDRIQFHYELSNWPKLHGEIV